VRAKLALLVGSLVLALLAAETALRLVSPLWQIPYPPVCFWPQLYQRHDPYGFRLWPSRTMTDAYPPAQPRPVAVVSNSDGFRSSREFRDGDPRPRIVALGDSMVFGPGVDAAERFTDRLEAMEPGWRVDNLGMVAYGPDLMLRALEEVGVGLHPQVVVFALLSHDLYRVMPAASGVGFPLPRFELVDGRLVTVPYPARPAWKRLLVVQGVQYAWWRYTSASFALNAAILDRVRALSARDRFVPAIVFFPPVRERWDDQRRRTFVATYAARHDVAFFDVTPALEAARKDRLYLPNDAHWNAEGHRVVAEALRPFLAGLVPGAAAAAR